MPWLGFAGRDWYREKAGILGCAVGWGSFSRSSVAGTTCNEASINRHDRLFSSRFEDSRISSLGLRSSSAPHQGSEGPDSSANRPICSTSSKLSGNVMRLMTGPCPQSCSGVIVLGVLPSPERDTSGQPTYTPYAPGDKVNLLRVQGSTHSSELPCEDRVRASTSAIQDFWLCFVVYRVRYVPKPPRKLSTEAKP